MVCVPIVLSEAEAADLYRYTLNSYICPRTYPALHQLLDRVTESRSSQRRDAEGSHAAEMKVG